MKRSPERLQGHTRRANAILLAVGIGLLLMAAGALVALHLQARADLLRDQGRNLHVDGLVDSGIALSLAKLAEDRFFRGPFEESLDGGEVHVEIDHRGPDRRKVVIEAFYGGESRRLEVMILAEEGRDPRILDIGPSVETELYWEVQD